MLQTLYLNTSATATLTFATPTDPHVQESKWYVNASEHFDSTLLPQQPLHLRHRQTHMYRKANSSVATSAHTELQ